MTLAKRNRGFQSAKHALAEKREKRGEKAGLRRVTEKKGIPDQGRGWFPEKARFLTREEKEGVAPLRVGRTGEGTEGGRGKGKGHCSRLSHPTLNVSTVVSRGRGKGKRRTRHSSISGRGKREIRYAPSWKEAAAGPVSLPR